MDISETSDIQKTNNPIKTSCLQFITAGLQISLLLLLAMIVFSGPLKDLVFASSSSIPLNDPFQKENEDKIKADQELLILKYKNQLQKNYPKEPYLIINTTENSYLLMQRDHVIREGICSTGSYVLLESDHKKWLFKTPRGMHRVLGKVRNPIWRKPDWAFVEDGLPIPSAVSELRYERGVLGNYAMSLGHGYMIHGTLYKRQLGLPVTHGCIRLADEDLEIVFNALRVGSKVFVY